MSLLKRKRSESEFSFSSTSTFSSPPRAGTSSFDFGKMDCGMSSPVRYGAAPSHLPSRTMKRLRDNRPSEEVIHQNTLRMLYSAQQRMAQEQQDNQMPQHQEQTSRPPTIDRAFSSQPGTPSSSGTPVQRSLHAFWNIPSAASMPNKILPPTGMDHRTESQEE